ncbi:hybrid sensor histidine kinase/response regulator [Pseudotabrizicola alkalilacus]|uniref:histidine kinase n=1 Tax=Pseudotabrizicola alkalilacus TaxID=2305252 RepID=A0A411Z1I1_9RHOB|nr:ATP-binding protein [Pseudotabrizicola alkalilacus]RGP36919.1 response regulator [Pseudotabrizicola alkalilacus]
MTHKNLRPKATAPLLALIVIALILVVFHGTLLLDRIGSKRNADFDNRSWLVAQLEVDQKELRIALLKARMLPILSREAERGVRLAFDIYYSRVLTVAAALSPINGSALNLDDMKTLEASRDEMAAVIDAVAFLRPQDIRQLQDISVQDAIDVRAVTSAAIQMFTQMEEARRIEDRDLLVRLVVLMGALLVLMVVGIVLAIRISQQAARRAGSAARTASNLRRTFEASLDGVVVSDGAGTITYLNAAASRMFGQNSSDLLGTSLVDTILPKQTANTATGTKPHVVRNGVSVPLVDCGRHRLMGMHRSGGAFPIEVSIVSDHDSDGQPVCIGFFRDITEEVEAENRLRSARDKARQDAAAKSRFLAIMSHEMRTPLHGVIAALDLMGSEKLSVTCRRFLATARACSHAALNQVVEVLEATRDGATEIKISPFDPQLLIADLLAGLHSLARARGNRLTLQPSSGPACPPLLGWQRGFLLVMRNLISNAVKFTNDGEITVSIRFEMQFDGRIALDIDVRDTGMGIDPANHERIFQEFEAVDTANPSATGGVGLGLAIARSAVERMGGRIRLQSALGHGSCFSVQLMMEAAPASVSLEATETATDENAVIPAHRGRRILVVDDNTVNTALMAEMLRRIGHQPETALDGPRAIALAREEAFDLILMDIGMPGMDGLATTRAIRAGGASEFCPVVGVTALVLAEDRERILESGMQDVLGKPLGLRQLSSYLADFFAEHLPLLDDDAEETFADVRALMGDEMMVQLLKGVQQDAEAALSSLRAMDADQDLQALRQALHRAAGSAAVVGAMALAEAMQDGEKAVLAGDIGKLRSCEAQILHTITATTEYRCRLQAGSV